MKTIKRNAYDKKPEGLTQAEKFPRERKLINLVNRCQKMEEHYEYVTPIYKVLPIIPMTGEIIYDQVYFECQMVSKKPADKEWFEAVKKGVEMVDRYGKTIKEFTSLVDASQYLVGHGYTPSISISGISHSISRAIGQRTPYLGYTWKLTGSELR
ncbi:hypothetical protein OB988_18680 [Bacillus cereus]|nr:hypothetical protein [Bacillus cereus]